MNALVRPAHIAALAALFAVVAVPDRVAAQSDPPRAEERIRGETRDGTPFSGTVVSLNEALLEVALRRPDVTVRIPREDLVTVEVMRGHEKSRSQGAFVGGLIGAGVGALAGFVLGGTTNDDYMCGGSCAVQGAVILGLGGGLVGTVFGLAIGKNVGTWMRVPLGVP